MRDLTKEELALAPSWATHYYAHDDKVVFESPAHFQMLKDGALSERLNNATGYITSMAVEIKRQPFDISKHEWSDDDVLVLRCSDRVIAFQNHDENVYLARFDAIAIAKHFGLTAEDLK